MTVAISVGPLPFRPVFALALQQGVDYMTVRPLSVTAAWWTGNIPYFALGRVTATSGSFVAMTAGRMNFRPFLVARNCTLDRLAIHVSVISGAGTKARLGVYGSDANGKPSALLADTEVLTDALNKREGVVALPLLAGVLYWAVHLWESTPTVATDASGSLATPITVLGTNPGAGNLADTPINHVYRAVAYGALPDPTLEPNISGSSGAPSLWGRFSA